MYFSNSNKQEQDDTSSTDEVLEVPVLIQLGDSVYLTMNLDELGTPPKSIKKKVDLLPEIDLTDDQASSGTQNWFIRLCQGVL